MDAILSDINIPEPDSTGETELGPVVENLIKAVEKTQKEPATDPSTISIARKARARRRYISTPTNLILTPAEGATTVQLDWTASASYGGVSGYKILRDGIEIADVTGVTYTDTDESLAASTQYTYGVYAYNDYQGTSGIVSGTTTTNAAV